MSRHVVICGAGSAGCTLAARLTEDPGTSVTLLEGGPDYPAPEDMPDDIRSAWIFGVPDHDWGFTSEAVAVSDNIPSWSVVNAGEVPMPRGKVVGGSSAVNGTNALRALPVDFARWQAMGADSWGWDSVLPYFRKLEDDPAGGSWHGTGGPIRVRRFPGTEQTPVTKAFIEACQGLGHRYVDDLNGPNPCGVGPLPTNQVDGVRQSAALCYLTPDVRARPNLTVRPDTLVDRVETVNGRAQAVILATGERLAGDTVVISAGSYCSPGILIRSGIGPADDLDRLGVPLVHANEAVGRNLRDHPFSTLAFQPTSAFDQSDPPLQTLLHRASSGTRDDSGIDLQVVLFTVDPARIFVGVALLRPYSIGRVETVSRDPRVAPRIVANFYQHPEDLARVVEGVKHIRELVAHPALKAYVGEEVFPGADVVGDAAIAAAVQGAPTTQAHPVGTCSMGPAASPWGVVDQRGAVHGVDGLYVIDASIMPTLPVVPTNLTTIMIAERCADHLRKTLTTDHGHDAIPASPRPQ
ncbi:GMC family oxidoreductase N-terminal domain-containing protein [Streptomyces javensis]|uniref:GMC family oxidoreductase n=1 Tax=Streptomyces javensis TaxID=114698 RepID=UPI0033D8183A